MDEERKALWDRTQREIDAIVSEFHGRLTRTMASAIGAMYVRYSTRFQDSAADQVRGLFEAALRERIFVPRENVFIDLAVRGFRDNRPGLNALKDALGRKSVQVLLVFATNRLHRKTYKALQFVEEEVVGRGVRCIFVASRIDTADGERWKLLLQLHAAMDEFVVGMYGDHVRAGQLGLFAEGLVYGTIPFGYTGEPIPGEMTKRKRPRCRLMIDSEAGPYVVKIYDWYVHDHLPIDELARRLNDDESAPLPPKSINGMWTRGAVRGVLQNTCYRGLWRYGKTQSIWQSKQDYARQFPREEALGEKPFEHLRLVSDDVWHAAQQRLLQNEAKRGRTPKDGNRSSRPRILNGILWCAEHNRPLYVGGSFGKYMFCKACQETEDTKRPLFSKLPRVLAVRMICEKLAELMGQDEVLVQKIIVACQRQAESAQQADPQRLRELRAQANRLGPRIRFILEHGGDTDGDHEETSQMLRQLRHERAQVLAEIGVLEAAHARPIHVPGREEVRSLLAAFQKVLICATTSDLEEDARLAREAILLLTGGRIELAQCGERRAYQGWLQARLQVRLLSALVTRLTSLTPASDEHVVEVTIDFRRERPSAGQTEQAYQLCEDGLLKIEIAQRLGVSKSRVTKLLHDAYAARGLEMPDGRSRRSHLAKMHQKPPVFQQIADAVMTLWHEGLLLEEISKRVRRDKNTVTKAVAFWHSSRGVPVPDGRTRRISLDRKTRSPLDRPGENGCSSSATD